MAKRDLPAEFIAQQWKPGQSGNPKGRKKRPSFEELVTQVLHERIPEYDITKKQALAHIFVDELFRRNGAMIREYLERAWPKVQHVELSEPPRSPDFVPTQEDQAELEERLKADRVMH